MSVKKKYIKLAKKDGDKKSDLKYSLWVYHYSKNYPQGRKKIRATFRGVKLFSGTGKYENKNHEVLFDSFYNDLLEKLEYQGRDLKTILYSDSNFFNYADKYIGRLSNKSSIANYSQTVELFKDFHNSDILLFNDITVDMGEKFKSWLFKKPLKFTPDKTYSTNSVYKHIKQIRILIRKAIADEETNLLRNPFERVKIKEEPVFKEFLTPNEIQMIIDFNIETSDYWSKISDENKSRSMIFESRAYLLFSCFSGYRISDIYDLTNTLKQAKNGTLDIKKGIVDFASRKVGKKQVKTGQVIYTQFREDAWSILEHFDFELPDITVNSINRNLKILAEEVGIRKKLNFHIGRHSYISRLLNEGISTRDVARHLNMDETTIKRHYDHFIIDDLSKRVDVIPQATFTNLKRPNP